MKESLADAPCPACTKDSPKLLGKDLAVQLGTLKSEWQAIDNHHLEKRFSFKDFSSALTYVNHVAALAVGAGGHRGVEPCNQRNFSNSHRLRCKMRQNF